jgi:hypothetical protein
MKKYFTTSVFAIVCTMAFAQAPTTGLVAYYKLNGNFNDAGPYAIHGTNFNATATTNNTGAVNNAMSFSNPLAAVAQYATVPVNANVNFTPTQDFSYDFFVYFNSPFVHYGGIYDNNLNYAGPGIWFWNGNGFTQIQFNFKNNSIGTTNGALALGVWQHITAIKAGSTLKLYVNGVLNNSGATGNTNPVYNYTPKFGTMFPSNFSNPSSVYNGLNGKIDEFRIYNKALSAAEISQLQTLLPIKLSKFTASLQQQNTLLQWQTSQEQNSKNFIVQRSVDGLNFTNLTTISAAGNTNIATNYTYTDDVSMVSNKKIYYRLQQNDQDEKQTFSNIIFVQKGAVFNSLIVYPNPIKNKIQLQINAISKEKATIHILDAIGKVQYTTTTYLQQGNNNFSYDLSTLQKGNYILKINTENKIYTQKFLKIE